MKKAQLLRYCLLGLSVIASFNAYGDIPELGISIYETSHIHNNGSGRFEIAADFSKAEPFIKVASLLTQVTPEAAQKSIQEGFAIVAQTLRRVPGIRSITTTHDAEKLHFKLSFQFNSIKALNEVFREIYAHIDHPGTTSFNLDRHAFTRVDTCDATQLLAHYSKKTDTQLNDLILKKFLNVITYNITYSFDRKIKQASNTRASISEDRLTLLLTQSLADACEEELSLSNTILF